MFLFTEKASTQLTIEMHSNSNSTISEETFEMARNFGIHLHEKDKENIEGFVIAFLTKLLHQREKIDLGLLDKELPESVKNRWQGVLSILEDKNRRVPDLRSGSLNFTLFCPSETSDRQLRDQQWKDEIQDSLRVLFDEIGTIYKYSFSVFVYFFLYVCLFYC